VGRIERKAKTNKIDILFKRPGPLEVEPFSEHFKITFYRFLVILKVSFKRQGTHSLRENHLLIRLKKNSLTHSLLGVG